MSAHRTEFELACQTAENAVVTSHNSSHYHTFPNSCLHAVALNQLFLASQRHLFPTLKKSKAAKFSLQWFCTNWSEVPFFRLYRQVLFKLRLVLAQTWNKMTAVVLTECRDDKWVLIAKKELLKNPLDRKSRPVFHSSIVRTQKPERFNI